MKLIYIWAVVIFAQIIFCGSNCDMKASNTKSQTVLTKTSLNQQFGGCDKSLTSQMTTAPKTKNLQISIGSKTKPTQQIILAPLPKQNINNQNKIIQPLLPGPNLTNQIKTSAPAQLPTVYQSSSSNSITFNENQAQKQEVTLPIKTIPPQKIVTTEDGVTDPSFMPNAIDSLMSSPMWIAAQAIVKNSIKNNNLPEESLSKKVLAAPTFENLLNEQTANPQAETVVAIPNSIPPVAQPEDVLPQVSQTASPGPEIQPKSTITQTNAQALAQYSRLPPIPPSHQAKRCPSIENLQSPGHRVEDVDIVQKPISVPDFDVPMTTSNMASYDDSPRSAQIQQNSFDNRMKLQQIRNEGKFVREARVKDAADRFKQLDNNMKSFTKITLATLPAEQITDSVAAPNVLPRKPSLLIPQLPSEMKPYQPYTYNQKVCGGYACQKPSLTNP